MHRFFLSPANIQDGAVTFTESISRQMVQVLRLKPDAVVMVLDGEGKEYQVRLITLSAQQCEGAVESVNAALGEPKTQLNLYLCLTQREKFEWILQKCTEVGVSKIIPVISSRSLLQEAAEQSHRGRVPGLEAPLRFAAAVKQAGQSTACCLIPWEEEKSLSLRQALQKDASQEVVLLIGPEGGFSAEEVALAQSEGFISVTLGKRILRMETAAVVASALVLYERGEMEGRLD
jgi:16S rRNA (uracil1498-N3)-methyltransferase